MPGTDCHRHTGGARHFPAFFRLHVSGKSALARAQRWSGSQSRERKRERERPLRPPPTRPCLSFYRRPHPRAPNKLVLGYLNLSASICAPLSESAAKTITFGANIVPRTRTASNRHPSSTSRRRTPDNLISILPLLCAAQPASFHTRGNSRTPSGHMVLDHSLPSHPSSPPPLAQG